jgi:hypothetical protein
MENLSRAHRNDRPSPRAFDAAGFFSMFGFSFAAREIAGRSPDAVRAQPP